MNLPTCSDRLVTLSELELRWHVLAPARPGGPGVRNIARSSPGGAPAGLHSIILSIQQPGSSQGLARDSGLERLSQTLMQMVPTLPRAAPVALGPALLPSAVRQASKYHRQALSSISDRSANTFGGVAEAPADLRQELASARLPVIDCISACVEADVRESSLFLTLYR